MQINFDELEEKLEGLTGLDFEQAQKSFKAKYKDESFGVVQLNSKFQIELAAVAIGVNANDLKSLPLKTYSKLCNKVQNFLLNDSEPEEIATE